MVKMLIQNEGDFASTLKLRRLVYDYSVFVSFKINDSFRFSVVIEKMLPPLSMHDNVDYTKKVNQYMTQT